MLATALVLVAAVLHAIWNTLIKFSGERLLVIACWPVMRYLKEPFGGPRLLACGLVLIGMLVMKL